MLEYLLREIKHGAENKGLTKEACRDIYRKAKDKSKDDIHPTLTDSYNRWCNGCGSVPIHKSNTSGFCTDCFIELNSAIEKCK